MSATPPTIRQLIGQGVLLLLDIRARGPRVVRTPPPRRAKMIDKRVAGRGYKVPAGTHPERN